MHHSMIKRTLFEVYCRKKAVTKPVRKQDIIPSVYSSLQPFSVDPVICPKTGMFRPHKISFSCAFCISYRTAIASCFFYCQNDSHSKMIFYNRDLDRGMLSCFVLNHNFYNGKKFYWQSLLKSLKFKITVDNFVTVFPTNIDIIFSSFVTGEVVSRVNYAALIAADIETSKAEVKRHEWVIIIASCK